MTIASYIMGGPGITQGVLKWQTITANTTGTTNNGYIAVASGGALQISLPATSNVGDEFGVVLDGATSWQITQAAGQGIRLNNQQTTTGVGGSLNSTNQGNSVVLLCDVANTHWVVIQSVGTLTVI